MSPPEAQAYGKCTVPEDIIFKEESSNYRITGRMKDLCFQVLLQSGDILQ